MSDSILTRRNFIQRLTVVGAATIGASYLVACGGESGESGEAGEAGEAMALDCSDVSSLSADQQATRTALQYVEASDVEGQNCTNCQQYQVPATEGGCGTCLVVPGTINPNGHCSSWAEKVS